MARRPWAGWFERPLPSLVRREWWEHRGGFLWTPVALTVLALLVALFLLTATSGAETSFTYRTEERSGTDTAISLYEWRGSVWQLLDFSAWSGAELEARLTRFRAVIALPFVWAHFLVALFVLLGSLHDDRRDRSVLFWKSLPVSDAETVASKLLLVGWVAPLVTVAAILLTQIAVLALVSVVAGSQGAGGLDRLWWHAGVGRGAIGLLAGYAVQGLWALPLYAWLLLVSAAVPRVPFVWALLLPIAAAVLERALLDSSALEDAIRAHLSFAALPVGGTGPGALRLLASVELWTGVVVALALLAGAIGFRRRNNDL